MVADLLDRAERSGEGTMVVKIVASQQGTTVGALLGDCHRVLKRTPRVVLGASPNARFQARDLRLRSVVWREIDARSLTTLPAGIKATSTGLLRSIQRGGLAS
jgi:UDP-glucose 4-epimerase